MEVHDTVSLRLDLAQTVAIGAFNPYVVKPEWLIKFGVCDRSDVDIRLSVIGDGAAFRFGTTEWDVDSKTLVVTTRNRDEDCGEKVSKVLALVPHTPVHAVGHNFHFSTTRMEWGSRPLPKLGGGDGALRGLEDLEATRWTGGFRRGNSRVELTLASEAEVIAILINHQRNMDLERMRSAGTAADQIAEAQEAAKQFRDDFEFSLKLLRSAFAMEMTDDRLQAVSRHAGTS